MAEFQPSVEPGQLPGRAYPNLPSEVSPQDFGSDIGQGLQQAAQHVFAEQLNAARAQVTSSLTAVDNGTVTLLHDSDSGALSQKGQNAFGAAQRYLPQFDAHAAEARGQIKNQLALKGFDQAVAQRRVQMQAQLDNHEMQQRGVYYDGVDQAHVETQIQRAWLNSGNPQVVTEAATEIGHVIDNQADRKGWGPEERAIVTGKAVQSLHEGVLQHFMAVGDTQSATAYLYGHMGDLDPKVAEGMQRSLVALEEHKLVMADKQQRQVNQAYSKKGDELLANGQLTADWVHQNSANLDPADVRYFYQKAGGGADAQRNLMLYADLRDRAGRGEDVRTDARALLQQNAIEKTDYDRLVGEVEKERPGWYKRGVEQITTSAAVSQLNPDPDASGRKVHMLDDWDDWASHNPNATPAEAAQARQQIVDEYGIIKKDKLTITMRQPRFLVGGRGTPDLMATKRATYDAFQTGKLNKDEYGRQAALIAQWQAALDAAPKKAAAK